MSSLHLLNRRVDDSPRWLRWTALGALFVVLSVVLTARYVVVHNALSPVDEYVFVDAVDKASRGIVVRDGQLVDDLAREAISCRGFGFNEGEVETVGRCGVAEPDSVYPWGAHTTAAIHSPVYYFVTAWIAKILMLAVPGVELITAARMSGAIWLALGMLVLAHLLRRVGSARTVAVAVPVLVASMPGFRLTNSYITPDALNLLAGSAVFLAGYLYGRRQWPLWPLLVIGSLVTLVKLQNCFAVIAVFIYLLWLKVSGRHDAEESSPSWWGVLMPPVLAAGAGAMWMVVNSMIALPRTQAEYSTDPAGEVNVFDSLFYLDDTALGLFAFNGGDIGTPASVFPSLVLWASLAALMYVAWLGVDVERDRRAFAQAGVVSLLGVGPAVNIFFALAFGSAVGMQPRYGMVLIPIVAVCTGWAVNRRSLRVAVVCIAVTAYLYALVFARAN